VTDRPVVAGVPISHSDRVIFPDPGITKLELARYYAAIAPAMVRHVADRPLTLVRCPAGLPVGSARAQCFFMKHSKVWAPEPLRRVRIREKTKIGDYLIADDAGGLVGLVQMGVVEIHTWNSRFADVERPDRVVLDIDPGEDVAWSSVVACARLVRDLLKVLGLTSFVKTTGGRGAHVVVPLTPRADWSECLAFSRAVAEALARRDPTFTTRFSKAGRQNKLLIDYLRNNRTNTSVAAFSTRARPGAPVSMPLTWTELSASRHPGRFTASVAVARARRRNDPWKDYWTTKQTIPRHAIGALERL
jgi:bifunctional non-homologous end joining protein LigD